MNSFWESNGWHRVVVSGPCMLLESSREWVSCFLKVFRVPLHLNILSLLGLLEFLASLKMDLKMEFG